MPTDLPQCEHRGNVLTSKLFCRNAKKPTVVNFEECHGCALATHQPPPEAVSPPCVHRRDPIASIQVGCAGGRHRQIYGCELHEVCTLTQSAREHVQRAKVCETCVDRSTDRPTPATVDQLAIIAVHFNPHGYHLPRRNYWEWRHHLGTLEQKLITVELSFNGAFMIPDSVQIEGTAANVMWQKEALINVGLKHLPPSARFVAWIDADLLFENDRWPEQAVAKLETAADVVQLFSSYTPLDRDRRPGETRPAAVAHHARAVDFPGYPAPGGAWAARRDYLERIGGLISNNIVGGGDQLACDSWTRTRSHYLDQYSKALQDDGRRWEAEAQQAMRYGVSYVAGNVTHLYHGEPRKRYHNDRAEILRRHNFDPLSDITINPAGLLEWNSDKPQLHRDVADYFAAREEDN